MTDIFDRIRLTPRQLRTVAQRRFDDADYLRRSGDNARANGVFYLGGFVIECLLKAKLLDRYPSMQRVPSPDRLSEQDRQIWSLIYRAHNLGQMLRRLPEVRQDLAVADEKEGTHRLETLNSICARWTIFARYSPLTQKMREAEAFLENIRDLKEWLR